MTPNNTHGRHYNRRKTAYDKPGPLRKIIRTHTEKELKRRLSENPNWQPVSEVVETCGRYEVLVELKNLEVKV